VHDVGVAGDRVAPGDEQRVGDDQRDAVPAAEGVPPGQPVGPEAALHRWDAGHEGDEDDDAVAGEQARDAAGVGEDVAEAGDRRGVEPPEAERRDRTGDDRTQHGVRVHRGGC
jgi:hypothetical protein